MGLLKLFVKGLSRTIKTSYDVMELAGSLHFNMFFLSEPTPVNLQLANKHPTSLPLLPQVNYIFPMENPLQTKLM